MLKPFNLTVMTIALTAGILSGEAAEKGGLIVHLGCDDGTQIAELLRDGDNRLVHGLDTDVENVEGARSVLDKLGLYGKASVNRFSGK